MKSKFISIVNGLIIVYLSVMFPYVCYRISYDLRLITLSAIVLMPLAVWVKKERDKQKDYPKTRWVNALVVCGCFMAIVIARNADSTAIMLKEWLWFYVGVQGASISVLGSATIALCLGCCWISLSLVKSMT